MANNADISENQLLVNYGETVCMNLLKDHTTQQNIYWATDSYADFGDGFGFFDPITLDKITSYVSQDGIVLSKELYDNAVKENPGVADKFREIIRPRAVKSKEEQTQRAKDKAEVFTPAWICNAQNNLIDEAWFGRKEGLFNSPDPENPQGWINNEDPISFEGTGKTWKDYVADMRLEITCGEAPYLCNRYDAVTGEYNQDVKYRIGMLDRKLRIVTENTEKSGDWILWGKIALRSTYGFEWQGDNLLLAREALFYTFLEHYQNKFGKKVPKKAIDGISYIVSWNVWQMDGLTYGLPGFTPRKEKEKPKVIQTTMFDDPSFLVEPQKLEQERPISPQERYCLIKDFFDGVNLYKATLDNSKDFHDFSAPKQTFESLVNNKQS